ncbi:MAG TPA: glycosyltransferase [Thermoanaerobaculia bacterium]|jgi:glycosyltransferase involved in cell wall biosynthesis|nr:glycosyltransferase [Thermoanaerobaculia bacterium]
MRITMVIGNLGGGGAERVCANLANAWAASGRDVTLLTALPGACVYQVDPRVQWRRLDRGGEITPRSLAPVLRVLRADRCTNLRFQAGLLTLLRDAILATEPDVVISHLTMTNIRVLAAMQETGIPVIACEHTDVTRVPMGGWGAERTALYRRARTVVATHEVCAGWLARHGARAVAIPNPLLPPVGTFPGRRAGRPRAVMLTRLAAEKRPGMAVRAFARTELRDWELHIHGDGPLRAQTERLIEEWAPGRVLLHPFSSEPYRILREADLFVSASMVEGFGNAIWEALACAVPVVAMDCGASVRSLVRHGLDGLLVRPDTTTALMEALASLMSDDARRAQLQPSVVERFPFQAAMAKWEEVLAA